MIIMLFDIEADPTTLVQAFQRISPKDLVSEFSSFITANSGKV